jgi:hypothetical protein
VTVTLPSAGTLRSSVAFSRHYGERRIASSSVASNLASCLRSQRICAAIARLTQLGICPRRLLGVPYVSRRTITIYAGILNCSRVLRERDSFSCPVPL